MDEQDTLGVEKPLFDPQNDKIKRGTAVVKVDNTQLAVCLVSVGVPLYQGQKGDPYGIQPYIRLKKASGKIQTIYNFYPKSMNGEHDTHDLVKAWHKDLDFIKLNPKHEFAIAMAVIKNAKDFHLHFTEVDPRCRVAFLIPGEKGTTTLVVPEGSKKHKAAVKRGYKQL